MENHHFFSFSSTRAHPNLRYPHLKQESSINWFFPFLLFCEIRRWDDRKRNLRFPRDYGDTILAPLLALVANERPYVHGHFHAAILPALHRHLSRRAHGSRAQDHTTMLNPTSTRSTPRWSFPDRTRKKGGRNLRKKGQLWPAARAHCIKVTLQWILKEKERDGIVCCRTERAERNEMGRAGQGEDLVAPTIATATTDIILPWASLQSQKNWLFATAEEQWH